MGQIFDRLSRFFKSESTSHYNEFVSDNHIDNEDEELKKIIEELNNQPNNDSKQDSNQDTNQDTNQSQPINSDIENAFRTLNINTNSNIEEIKLAYKKLIKEYHPDKIIGLDKDKQSFAKSKAQEINAAYTLLKRIKDF